MNSTEIARYLRSLDLEGFSKFLLIIKDDLERRKMFSEAQNIYDLSKECFDRFVGDELIKDALKDLYGD